MSTLRHYNMAKIEDVISLLAKVDCDEDSLWVKDGLLFANT